MKVLVIGLSAAVVGVLAFVVLAPQPAGTIGVPPPAAVAPAGASRQQTLREARAGFVTKIVTAGPKGGPPDDPRGTGFELIRYASPVGDLAAYVTPDPGDGRTHPAIVWITGGDCNSIGDVWSPQDRRNDQSAGAFRRAGVVTMFPSLRGGNDNPGRHEGFFGEVDDVLAATDHLAGLPYVDAGHIYLGGHSTGGTLVLLVGACSDRYRAIFSLGPVAAAVQYGDAFMYCPLDDEQELRLRSPIAWLHCLQTPTYVIEGAAGNWDGSIDVMAERNTNPQVRFLRIPGHDHFSVIAPTLDRIAAQVAAGTLDVTEQTLRGLR